jgi:hypothetical protein
VIQLLQQLYAEFPTPELQKYIETAQAANHPTTVTGAQGFSPYIPRAQRARFIPPPPGDKGGGPMTGMASGRDTGHFGEQRPPTNADNWEGYGSTGRKGGPNSPRRSYGSAPGNLTQSAD